MRLSVNKGDPGYEAHQVLVAKGNKIRIFLNGVEMHYCMVADDNERLVVCLVKDKDGRFVLAEDSETMITETLYGRVEIVVEGQPSERTMTL